LKREIKSRISLIELCVKSSEGLRQKSAYPGNGFFDLQLGDGGWRHLTFRYRHEKINAPKFGIQLITINFCPAGSVKTENAFVNFACLDEIVDHCKGKSLLRQFRRVFRLPVSGDVCLKLG
jgi:hypothetical protein